MIIDLEDQRWGGYIPWFLHHGGFPGEGDFPTFFSRLSQRLERLFRFNECNVNLTHFGPWLETESLQRFRDEPSSTLNETIFKFFHPASVAKEAEINTFHDKEEKEASDAESFLKKIKNIEGHVGGGIVLPRVTVKGHSKREQRKWERRARELREVARNTREQRTIAHYRELVLERLAVLEVLLRILPSESSWKASLMQDIRRFFAESQIMLDVRNENELPKILPLDEPLLQREVLDALLPRLSLRFPERARELVGAYHNFFQGADGDSVFSEAFKTLEEIARGLTGDRGFEFDKSHLTEHFPRLHPTVHQTLIRLAGHRGDKAGHGKDAPPPHEIRYLLFAICNSAYLLLDYPSDTS